MRDVVKITEPGGRILDPFAGSGSTVLAAVLEGYSATGIEVTDAYAALSKERIARELAQGACRRTVCRLSLMSFLVVYCSLGRVSH